MNLIVLAPLSEPPTESLPFRYVLSCASIDCKMDILLECEPGTEDLYWKFLNQRGMFDFVSDIVGPLQERGLRLDTKVRNQSATVIAVYIRMEKQLDKIERIKDRLI